MAKLVEIAGAKGCRASSREQGSYSPFVCGLRTIYHAEVLAQSPAQDRLGLVAIDA